MDAPSGGGKKDRSPGQQVELALLHWPALERLVVKLGEGPWAATLDEGGVREYRLPDD